MNACTTFEAVASPPREDAWVNLGSLEKVPLGQGRCFLVGTEEIAVFRLRDGKLCALQNRCPHRGAPLADGVVGNGKVVCPFHSFKYDLETGRGVDGPDDCRSFPVRAVNGELLLAVGE